MSDEHAPQDPTPSPPHRTGEASEPTDAGGRPATVLVVDDEPSIARLIAWTLEDAGFRVQVAVDGWSALESAQAMPPDAILLDLALPDIPGEEVFRRVRLAGVSAPVMIVSAHGARRAQQALGADAALEKPFDPQTMLDRVERLLDRGARR